MDKIQYEKTFQGAHRFYTLKDGQLITRQYFFCTKREALADFKAELKGDRNAEISNR